MQIQTGKCYNLDCEIGMKAMQEQGLIADWCITDVPYGINITEKTKKTNGTRYGNGRARKGIYECGDWDKRRIDDSYFDLMRSVSKNQIIFGGGITQTFSHRRAAGLYGTKKPTILRTEIVTVTANWRGVTQTQCVFSAIILRE